MKEFNFIWSIENISYAWHKTGEKMVSPKFTATPLQDTCWTLRLYPRGHDDSDYFSLFLYREEDEAPEDLRINFELSCIAADKSVLYTWLAPKKYIYFSKGTEFGETQFIKRLEVFGPKKDLNLPQDILTLRCRMWIEDGDINDLKQMYGRTRLPIERIVSVEEIYLEPMAKKTFEIYSKSQNTAMFTVSVEYCSNGIDVSISPVSNQAVRFSTCKLTLVDKEMKRRVWEERSSSFKGPLENVWRFPLPIKDKEIEKSTSNTGDFQFTTEFVYSTGEESTTLESKFPSRIPEFYCAPNGRERIFKELFNLYHEKFLCDIELKTENKSFFAHKFVLCARSPVFLAIIKDKVTTENKCIEIEDISSDILEKFLVCLYKDELENVEWDSVIELYYAADKYQVERLKHLCCSYLAENVNCDRICDLLILADRYNDSKLKQYVEGFIWKNEEEMVRPTQWDKYTSEQRELAMKTILSKNDDKENQKTASKTSDDIISSHTDALDDFKHFYQGHIMSDITIKTKSATFPAHKLILCASSSTFKDMISTTKSDFLEMEDLEDNIVSEMLQFLYTDSLEDVQWSIALKLYHTADVFQIPRLKFKCSCFLLENLNVSNASYLLLLAHEHHDDKLKSAVEDYILLVDEELFGSDEWAEFSKSNLQLANQTMTAKYTKNKSM